MKHTTVKWPFKCEKHSITEAFELQRNCSFCNIRKGENKTRARERKAPSTDAEWKQSSKFIRFIDTKREQNRSCVVHRFFCSSRRYLCLMFTLWLNPLF